LSATDRVTAAINSLGDRTGLGLAGSKTGGEFLTAGRKVGDAIEKIPGEGLSSKNIAKEIDKFSDTVMGALTEYGNSGTGAGKLAEAFVDFAGFVKTELKDSFSNVKEQANKLTVELPFLSALINAGKVTAGGPPANTQIPTTTNNTTSSAGNSSGTQGSNSEVTHTLNVNFDSKNPNISAEQVKEAFNDSGVKQKMINVFNEIYSNPIGAPIPKKNEK
jgi:hypothetical protein